MAIRTVQELVKTQQEMVDRMRKQLDAAGKGGKPALTVVRQAKERELAYLKERLGETEEAQAAAAERYGAQIKAQRAAIERLQKEIEDLDKQDKEKPPSPDPSGPRKAGGTRKK